MAATKKMVECLDPAVDLYEAILDIMHLKDPYKSALFLMVASVAILHYEAALALSLIGILIFIQYNAYYRRVYEPHSVTYVKNAQFLLLLMNLVTESAEIAENFVRNTLYWGKPARSVLAMNVALFGCIGVYVSLKFLPLRGIAVLILWLGALRNSEFFTTLGRNTLKELQKTKDKKKKQASLIDQLGLKETKDKILENTRKVIDLMILLYYWPILPVLRFLASFFGHIVWLVKAISSRY